MKQLIAMLACILLSSSVSSGIFAQTQNVRFSRERMKISEVFSAIEQQTGLTVAYNESALDLSGVVSVPSETNVSDLLASVLKNTGNSFYFHGKMILVYKEKQVKTSTYSGIVVDKAGPVAGAAVMVEGTDQVTVTGVDGKFAINAPQGSVLKVSMLGYKEFTVTAGPQTDNLRFLVEEDNRLLDESVVVGYASMKKRDLVGAVDQVKSDVIENRSNGNLARSLQGEIAGLNISFTDSKPSRSASFNVRGTTSVGAGGSSLVLIDGVEGSLNSINPQDVESVSVLKDASSTAVYGARGAFGVILVTTKNPQKGRPVINYNGSVTVNRRTVVPDVITDGQDWLDWWKDCYMDITTAPSHCSVTLTVLSLIARPSTANSSAGRTIRLSPRRQPWKEAACSAGHIWSQLTGMTCFTRITTGPLNIICQFPEEAIWQTTISQAVSMTWTVSIK